MSVYRALTVALRALGRHRLRAFFMMLGVTVGVASLTAVASVGESTKQDTMRRFKRMLGTFDTVIVRPGAGRQRGMPSLTTVEPTLKFEDARAIAEDVPAVRAVAEVQNAFDVDVKYRDQTASPAIFGVSTNWIALRDQPIAEGRGVTDEDVRSLARIAIVGADVKASLFANDSPLGATIRIADVPFQVVGVLSTRGAGPGGAPLDNVVVIPVSTASRRLFNRDFLTMVIAQLRDPDQNDAAVAAIARLLRARHRLAATAEDDFTITNPRAAMARVNEVGSTLSTVLIGVGLLATAIGGVVIMSLMTMSVTARRQEIGVRRAVGANRRDVLLQFLIEATAISSIGGAIGITLGIGGAAVATVWQQLPAAIAWSAVAGAVGLSVTIGVAFGVHPAWKASAVDPIAALRL